MITLSPERVREFVDALADAFTPEDLDRKVADPLGVPATERSAARETRERALTLVQWATRQKRLADLLGAALQGNPTNTTLRRINEAHGLVAASSDLVEVLREALPPGGDAIWLRDLAAVHRQVCRIRIDAKSAPDKQFTGFLVGPDQVMTYTGAISEVLGADGQIHGTVALEFEEGASVGLDRKQPVVVAVPDGALVLRIEREIARETSRTDAQVAVRSRGWITPPSSAAGSKGALVIVQASPLGITVAADAAGNLGSDGNTIRYRTTTHLGSLGAPCFDEKWQLLGMHIGSAEADANHGRAVEAIVRGLESSGFGWDVSRGVHPIEAAAQAESVKSLDHVVSGIAKQLTASDDVWSDEVEDLDLPVEERWAWVEAAAVHASFDPDQLRPFGKPSRESRVALLLESRRVGDRWVLSERLRKRSLKRLAERGELAAARAANPTDATDPADGMLGELIAGRTPTLSDPRDPQALRSLLTVVDWLDGCVATLPDPQELLATLERATLLAPFLHLTRGFFAGREAQLARLTAYAAGGGDLPLFIHGPGGMGKSALLARFVLSYAKLDPTQPSDWRPFIYLDFDRAELDATDQVGVLLAVARQLRAQVPAIGADAQAFVQRWLESKRSESRQSRRPNRRARNLAQQISPQDVSLALAELIDLLQRSTLPGTPMVLILDTLEEVQFATPDAIEPLIELVAHLRKGLPALRPIFAGRIAVEGAPVEPLDLPPLAPAAAEALLSNELPPDLAAKPKFVARVAAVVGGNPLSLRLAAECLRREARDADAAIEELSEDLRDRVSDAIVQGRLYQRILGHIHEARVAKVAYPGFVLRRITWELIRDVLAVPCGLGALTDVEARTLCDALAKEVALVRRGPSDGALELRPELRRVVIEDLANDRKATDKRLAIHRAAVAFYTPRTTPVDRAEEIYHRLALGEDPADVDKRWITGLEPLLRGAVGELPAASASYLSNRVGGVADAAQIENASPIEWEEWAGKRAGDLLKFDQPAKALELLATRSERLPTSKLHYVESIAQRMLPVPDLAGAEAAADRAVAAARASAHSEDLRDALEELVKVRRLRGDTAGVLRALADLGNLGDALGDDLVLLQSEVEGLESLGTPENREQFTYDAVRVFSRLPDEIVAQAPELSRRVAAQVGGTDPATLRRVIRLVGVGSIGESAAEGLRGVLSNWQNTAHDISAFVPAGGKSAYELASAAQYLVSTRELDSETATELAAWLGSVVTPKGV